MKEQKPLTQAQKTEKARYLLVMFENIENAKQDFELACKEISREFQVSESFLKKAIKLKYNKRLSSEVENLEIQASKLEDLCNIFNGLGERQ